MKQRMIWMRYTNYNPTNRHHISSRQVEEEEGMSHMVQVEQAGESHVPCGIQWTSLSISQQMSEWTPSGLLSDLSRNPNSSYSTQKRSSIFCSILFVFQGATGTCWTWQDRRSIRHRTKARGVDVQRLLEGVWSGWHSEDLFRVRIVWHIHI